MAISYYDSVFPQKCAKRASLQIPALCKVHLKSKIGGDEVGLDFLKFLGFIILIKLKVILKFSLLLTCVMLRNSNISISKPKLASTSSSTRSAT